MGFFSKLQQPMYNFQPSSYFHGWTTTLHIMRKHRAAFLRFFPFFFNHMVARIEVATPVLCREQKKTTGQPATFSIWMAGKILRIKSKHVSWEGLAQGRRKETWWIWWRVSNQQLLGHKIQPQPWVHPKWRAKNYVWQILQKSVPLEIPALFLSQKT